MKTQVTLYREYIMIDLMHDDGDPIQGIQLSYEDFSRLHKQLDSIAKIIPKAKLDFHEKIEAGGPKAPLEKEPNTIFEVSVTESENTVLQESLEAKQKEIADISNELQKVALQRDASREELEYARMCLRMLNRLISTR